MLKVMDELFEYILVKHRWLFVVPFLLPLTVLFELYSSIRNWIIFRLNTAPQLHEQRVRDVQRQVRRWGKSRDTKMCTARPGWQTMSFRRALYKSSMFNVKIDMPDILCIDIKNKFVRLEPMVTMGQLTRTLEPLGWTLPVVPELDDLTIGGLVMGTGVESSSHKYGLFEEICLAYELVMSDGSLVRCSKDENSELFRAVPWSHGSIGFLVAVEIQIIPARKFVELRYHPLTNLHDTVEKFKEASEDPANEFVEVIVFSLERAVLMTGVMVDQGEPVNSIGCWYKPWFFKHVESKFFDESKLVEYIPLRDYYHRHSRSLFWEIQDIVPFANHPLFRYFLGWTMPPKVSLLKLTQTGTIKRLYETKHFLQDLLLPMNNLKDALKLFDSSVKIYPLWLCPFKLKAQPGFVHARGTDDEMYVDVGVYGVPKASDFESVSTTRKIEKFLIDIGGYQMLYADTYTTRDEFKKMFDHTLYEKVRKMYDCENAFPEVYDKVNKTART